MRRLLNFTICAVLAWVSFVVLCSYLDNHCDGEHATECALEYGLWRPCSLGLDDK